MYISKHTVHLKLCVSPRLHKVIIINILLLLQKKNVLLFFLWLVGVKHTANKAEQSSAVLCVGQRVEL